MKFIKKYWYLVIVTLFTLGLGVVVYLTSQQLTNTQQIAPTAPQAQPEAAATCKLTFSLEIATTITPTETETETPTPTDTETPTPTPTDTETPTPEAVNETPIQQVVYVYPTATPETIQNQNPVASCNNACTVNADCGGGGLVCISGYCRNAACAADTTCSCAGVAVGPTPKTPVSGGPTVLGASVIGVGALILILGLAL